MPYRAGKRYFRVHRRGTAPPPCRNPDLPVSRSILVLLWRRSFRYSDFGGRKPAFEGLFSPRRPFVTGPALVVRPLSAFPRIRHKADTSCVFGTMFATSGEGGGKSEAHRKFCPCLRKAEFARAEGTKNG